jgi:uncharacterized protein (TIGR02246 family)
MQIKHMVIVFTAIFALGRAPAMSHQSSAGGSEDKDRAAIARTLDRFRDAWNTHDAHAFALTFTDDVDFTNVAGAHAHGRADIEAFHAPVFAGIFKDSHQTDKIHSIRFLKPDLAAVDIDWEMTGAKSPDGKPRPYRRGLLNWVMAKQADGSWLILVMHNTELTDYPAPAK